LFTFKNPIKNYKLGEKQRSVISYRSSPGKNTKVGPVTRGVVSGVACTTSATNRYLDMFKQKRLGKKSCNSRNKRIGPQAFRLLTQLITGPRSEGIQLTTGNGEKKKPGDPANSRRGSSSKKTQSNFDLNEIREKKEIEESEKYRVTNDSTDRLADLTVDFIKSKASGPQFSKEKTHTRQRGRNKGTGLILFLAQGKGHEG